MEADKTFGTGTKVKETQHYINFTSVVSKGNPKDRLDIPLLSPVRSLILPNGGRSAGSINKEPQVINPTLRPQ